MFGIKNKTVSVIIILMFVITMTFAFLFNSYELAVSGMLVLIVLTAFIPGWKSTLVAGVLSIVLMTLLVLYFKKDGDIMKALLSQVYSLLVILFAAAIVFYLKRIQQNIAHEKAHMTSLFENATEGILLTDKEGNIVLVNPAANRMFGYETTELIGEKIEKLIPTRYHGHHAQLRHGFYEHPGNRPMGKGRDLFARRKDNSEFPVEISLSHYLQKNEPFVIAFIVDITTRKEHEQNVLKQKKELEKISNDIRLLNAELEGKVEERTLILKEALQKLEESQQELSESLDKEKQLNEIKSRFVSMASHEFRTPLSTILSSASLVSKYPSTEEFDKRERHIRRIKDSVNHLNDLLEDFLSLGKLEEGKVAMKTAEFATKEFMDEVIEEMRVQAKKDQEIIFDYQGNGSFITDKRMLKNILINLISNAIKFSGEGKKISINTTNENNHLKIVIGDSGLGIPPDDLPHLFSTFFRAKNVSNIQGTGLGLPIVKRYVELLKGEITVRSELDRGSVFTLRIPMLAVMN